jgi:hypothetical protein
MIVSKAPDGTWAVLDRHGIRASGFPSKDAAWLWASDRVKELASDLVPSPTASRVIKRDPKS